MSKLKRGDRVEFVKNTEDDCFTVGVVKNVYDNRVSITYNGVDYYIPAMYAYKIEDTPVSGNEGVVVSDGGPASYYDFPESWTTFNDFIESKSQRQWKGYSFHLGNIGKAICRWGDKGGTTIEYDAKKIIYSACRVLKMIVGKDKLREYLNTILNDEQFK